MVVSAGAAGFAAVRAPPPWPGCALKNQAMTPITTTRTRMNTSSCKSLRFVVRFAVIRLLPRCKRPPHSTVPRPLPTTRRILYTIAFMALLRSVATVGGYTMISRVLGFVRDMLTAQFLGAGPVADAFFVAFRLPNLFRSFFAEGAFNSAFVPLFAGGLAQHGRLAAKRFAEDALSSLTAVLFVFLLVCEVAAPALIHVLAPGFADDPPKFQLTVELARITFPYLLFISLVALQGGILTSVERFAA